MIVIYIIIFAIVVEAITEIIVEAQITDPIRGFIKRKAYPDQPIESYSQNIVIFIDKLLSCGYCTSVWVSFVVASFHPPIIGIKCIDWILAVFLIHRLSNLYHVMYQLVMRGRVLTIDARIVQSEEE